MNRKALTSGLAAAGALALVDWSRKRDSTSRIEITRFVPATPEALVDLIRQVEREPEFIPGVLRVDVYETGEDWVRYQVYLPAGTWAIFRKTWTAGRIAWISESGSFGLHQAGLMELIPSGNGSRVALTVQTDFDPSPAGGALAAASNLYARNAFEAWLRNLGAALGA